MSDKRTKTIYEVKYPNISSVITKEVVDFSYNPPTLPDTLRTENWNQAHEYLRTCAMRRVTKAHEEMASALKHLEDVLKLKHPDQTS